MKSILVFQDFDCKDTARRAEFDNCIKHNLEAGFDEIILFNDSVSPRHRGPRIKNIEGSRRITYRDFIDVVNDPNNLGSFVVLTNTDIKLDPAILNAASIIKPYDFLCWTRYESNGELPQKPWNTQDTWALLAQPVHNSIRFQSDIPLGMPGCEIRFAEIMFSAGYRVFNPSIDIKNIHVHSVLQPHEDKNRIYGAAVFTAPCTLEDIKTRNPKSLGVPTYATRFPPSRSLIPFVHSAGVSIDSEELCPCGSGKKFGQCHGL